MKGVWGYGILLKTPERMNRLRGLGLMFNRKEYLKEVKRIVIKVGTSSITHSTGLLNLERMESLTRQIADLHNRGIEVILVSSGAIGAGMGKMNLKERPKTVPEKQAAAAVGQGVLIHMYQKTMSEYGKTIAQILVTKDDLADRSRFLNARNTIFSLLAHGVIPIVNENDAVATDELKYGNKIGDNDTLSALMVSLVDAELLVILSDIDGLYDENPAANPNARMIPEVHEVTQDILDMAGGTGTSLGTGGMATKIKAAQIATSTGADMLIARSSLDGVLYRLLEGESVGTLFLRKDKAVQARQHWIGYSSRVTGEIHVDEGAAKAMCLRRKSLLPSGITGVTGGFKAGEIVAVKDPDGKHIANGVTNYDSHEIEMIRGLKTEAIISVLGYKDYDEVIHANNMLIIGGGES